MDGLFDRMNVRAASYAQEIRRLSGGNQQKAIVARWLALEPKVLIFVEPTRGIDVNAKAGIYHLMRDLARGGAAIMMVSSDLPEVIGAADRIIVMRAGTHRRPNSRAAWASRDHARRNRRDRRRRHDHGRRSPARGSSFDALERIARDLAGGCLAVYAGIALGTGQAQYLSLDNLIGILWPLDRARASPPSARPSPSS